MQMKNATQFDRVVHRIKTDVMSLIVPGTVSFEVEHDSKHDDDGYLYVRYENGATHLRFTIWICESRVMGISVFGGYFRAIEAEDIGSVIYVAIDAVDGVKRELKAQIMNQF